MREILTLTLLSVTPLLQLVTPLDRVSMAKVSVIGNIILWLRRVAFWQHTPVPECRSIQYCRSSETERLSKGLNLFKRMEKVIDQARDEGAAKT